MTESKKVDIRIESISPDQSLVQSVSGEMYLKGNAVYLRYPEPDPAMGQTTTTVKVTDQQIKVIRHGSIRSEQVFLENKPEWGYYHTAQGQLKLETHTQSIHIQLTEGLGTIAWIYDLYVAGEQAGNFQ